MCIRDRYGTLDGGLFDTKIEKAPLLPVEDLRKYNSEEGLALSDEEIDYLEGVARELGRPLTDAELFGFSQVNSEHCRHKILAALSSSTGRRCRRASSG